jgi:starvation-inducible DNA-binding protein
MSRIAARSILSVIVEPTDMSIPKASAAGDEAFLAPPMNDAPNSDQLAHFEELLAHSVRLRDMYKRARWQTADIQVRVLRLLFDDHYREQLRLVDVLMDRIRMLGGSDRIFAGVFLQGSRFSCALRGRASPCRLLEELLEAHDLIIGSVRAVASSTGDGTFNRDFAVGQVVLANELQHQLLGEQLMRTDSRQRLPNAAAF